LGKKAPKGKKAGRGPQKSPKTLGVGKKAPAQRGGGEQTPKKTLGGGI